jgi:hypothetical protein
MDKTSFFLEKKLKKGKGAKISKIISYIELLKPIFSNKKESF